MTDRFTPKKRSAIMANIKGRDTIPEKVVRSTIHQMGFRFRLQARYLPGNPDIVLPKYGKVVFVHGCFWHGHKGCNRASRPTTNVEFWNRKIDGNIQRDARVQRELKVLGWKVLTVWQCQIRNVPVLQKRLKRFLNKGKEEESR